MEASSRSESYFSARELFADKAFLVSLAGSIAAAAGLLSAVAVWAYQERIVIRPIVQVVSVEDSNNLALKPISGIKFADKDSKTTAWTGWAIRLSDLCQAKGGAFSKGFSEEFQNDNAKLVIPSEPIGSWTVANAKLTGNTCDIVTGEREARDIYAIFDSKNSLFGDKQVKAVFVPKADWTGPGL